MARKAAKARPEPVEPEDESQEAPEEPAAGGGEVTTKADAVRRALAAGKDGPQEGTAYIRQEFGIEIAPQHFSAVKSQLKKRERGGAPKGRPGRKPKAAASELDSRPARTTHSAADNSNLIEDMAAVKHLVQRLGAEQVRKIVGLFE